MIHLLTTALQKVNVIPKSTIEDSIFTVTASDPHSAATKEMIVPAGTMVMIHPLDCIIIVRLSREA